jgi:hypothetical protein
MSVGYEFYLAASLRDLTSKGTGLTRAEDAAAIRAYAAEHPDNARAAQHVKNWLPPRP